MDIPTTESNPLWQLLESTWEPSRQPNPDSIPWSEIIDLLVANNLGALTYTLLKESRHLLPEEIRQAFSHEFYLTVALNTQCLTQLSFIKDTLDTHGIPFILLKGAALAATLYPSPSSRNIGDIDLLIPRKSVSFCREIFLQQGYKPAHIEHQPGSTLRHSNEEMLIPPAPLTSPLELHWHLLDVPYYLHKLPMDWFWEHTESLEIGEEDFLVLNPEANLIYLPAHLAIHHRYQELHPLLDLALLIIHDQNRINWEKVIRTAQQFDLFCALRETLNRLSQYWSSLPIQEPRRLMEDVQPSENDRRLFHLLSTETRTTTLDFYTNLITLPSFQSRLRYALVNLFPQSAYMKSRYNTTKNWHLPFWYLYRLTGGIIRIFRMLPVALRLDRESIKTDEVR